jgi:hypothetical protein
VNVTIGGLSDPDGDPVSLVVDSVKQDEPVNGLGDGDASPDAFITPGGAAPVRVRRERAGGGDGRVYHITFTATDSHGASCSSTSVVCVPHSMSGAAQCVDGGPLHISTVP